MTKLHELDTPTLLLDIKKLEKNINTIASFTEENGLALRPHIKTHKSIHIANMQIESGAVGITTAKVSEAEVMAAGGIKDILIAYPISSHQKIHKLVQLLMIGVSLKIAVDNTDQLRYLQQELEHSPYKLEVWIKVNSGLHRCGVEPGVEAVKLAKEIMSYNKLELGGIFTHAGHSYAANSIEEIDAIGVSEGKAVVDSANDCEREGIPIRVRSVGSTPTYRTAGKVPGITEVRPGNAVFFDSIQVGLGVASFDNCALSLLSSVVGEYKDRIVLDTGSKSLCLDKGAHGNETVKGFGSIVGHPEVTIARLSEEHGVGTFTQRTTLKLTDKVQIIPNHACTVVNQFQEYVVHDGEKVVDLWKIDARGMVK
ncbi:alanine racemase [Bacillus salitolerans]|uniref:Alanine racemase n=1 Tax=Bacillus salitolerans TaxID=1437434 RepID=A0ABW4LY34_9BACI